MHWVIFASIYQLQDTMCKADIPVMSCQWKGEAGNLSKPRLGEHLSSPPRLLKESKKKSCWSSKFCLSFSHVFFLWQILLWIFSFFITWLILSFQFLGKFCKLLLYFVAKDTACLTFLLSAWIPSLKRGRTDYSVMGGSVSVWMDFKTVLW